ncbi:MAG: hypothetical protein A2Z52_00965 [Candidatus Moranbacteria bacterium RBG_19FT_COMBO_42_6]|nr:MAG: hypothetical protein A2Z52_00965 [Candidatus Moranbacteria bacterium RBG_19FT_COMBO_42_6]
MEDPIIDLLACTYRLDVAGVEKNLKILWSEYQKIIHQKSNWKNINRARAILYFIGYIYPEWITVQSLERRIRFIKPPLTLNAFLVTVDRNDQRILKKYKNNEKFKKLSRFYKIVKSVKNKVANGTYLDENTFNEQYEKLKPKDHF